MYASRLHAAGSSALCCLCLAGGCGPAESSHEGVAAVPQPDGPNVVLISIDTLRPDHLGCYGYARETSPRIDGMAAEGVVFENHISSTSWTLPAHAALFTSLADSVHGCTDTDKRLDEAAVTLAERFAAAGYATAGFFSGAYLHPAFGLGQGFEHYENCTSYATVIDSAPVGQWAMDPDVMKRSHSDVSNPTVYGAVKKWLDRNGHRKFFMFIHLYDVHFDFLPPAPYDRMFDPDYTGSCTGEGFFFDAAINARMPGRDKRHLIALYDGEIAWTDHHVGMIMDDLRRAGLLDDTVVALTSDHGTEFFEHGGKGHRLTLYDEVIRIPLVIRYPAGVPARARVSAQTRSLDVGPTLLELAGLPAPDDVMGASLVPLAHAAEVPTEPVAISELFSVGRNMRSVRSRKWKLTERLRTRTRTLSWVDLIDDPQERKPTRNFRTEPGPDIMESYRAALADLQAWRTRLPLEADPSAIPDEIRRQLESLGYLKEP